MQAAIELEPAIWSMQDQAGEYARIELRRTPDGLRYRVTIDGETLGWATTLRTACERAHSHYLRAHTPGFNGYPDLSGST